ncbi:uncharacterized protein LOC103128212 [Erinaceus europaeus]|uniref:Uncharacterized protein LOC103128212 n=1 Tax=Erinaceus europaeus TaxID=9365 RepID=A0ABM3WT99_ERIEU|nr:uncharacterized protein LOC103128212 [Erinaceus europaeus]
MAPSSQGSGTTGPSSVVSQTSSQSKEGSESTDSSVIGSDSTSTSLVYPWAPLDSLLPCWALLLPRWALSQPQEFFLRDPLLTQLQQCAVVHWEKKKCLETHGRPTATSAPAWLPGLWTADPGSAPPHPHMEPERRWSPSHLVIHTCCDIGHYAASSAAPWSPAACALMPPCPHAALHCIAPIGPSAGARPRALSTWPRLCGGPPRGSTAEDSGQCCAGQPRPGPSCWSPSTGIPPMPRFFMWGEVPGSTNSEAAPISR